MKRQIKLIGGKRKEHVCGEKRGMRAEGQPQEKDLSVDLVWGEKSRGCDGGDEPKEEEEE